jgi:hypothetical protein
LDSESREVDALMACLEKCARCPSLYGTPREVEGLAKHVTHVLLTANISGWRYRDTKRFWRDVAASLGYGRRFARDADSTRIKRWNRWGPHEDVAMSQVVAGYSRIWKELASEADFPWCRRWIEVLLQRPGIVGKPDVLDGVLFGLMVLALGARGKAGDVRRLWEGERRKVGGDAVRGLSDVGSRREWDSRSSGKYLEFSSMPCVVAGISEVIRRLRATNCSVSSPA